MRTLDDRLAATVTENKQGSNAANATSETADKTPKGKAIAALLANVELISLREVCQSIGWNGKDETDSPKQKHIKVAIVHVLIETAKKHNWHLIHDGGFF